MESSDGDEVPVHLSKIHNPDALSTIRLNASTPPIANAGVAFSVVNSTKRAGLERRSKIVTAIISKAAINGPINDAAPNGGSHRKHAADKPRIDKLVRTNESDVRSDCRPPSGDFGTLSE